MIPLASSKPVRFTIAGLLLANAHGFAAGPGAICVAEAVGPREATEFVTQAVEVLRSCGHDPASYRVELRMEDPFTLAGTGRNPEIEASGLDCELP